MDRLYFDLIAPTVVTCPDPCSESCDDDNLLCFCAVVEVWGFMEELAVFLPCLPVFRPCCGIFIHDARLNCSPRRHDITREESFCGKRKSVQEVFCGKGKSLEKERAKDVVLVDMNVGSLNDLDATSASLLSIPAIDIVNNGNVCIVC